MSDKIDLKNNPVTNFFIDLETSNVIDNGAYSFTKEGKFVFELDSMLKSAKDVGIFQAGIIESGRAYQLTVKEPVFPDIHLEQEDTIPYKDPHTKQTRKIIIGQTKKTPGKTIAGRIVDKQVEMGVFNKGGVPFIEGISENFSKRSANIMVKDPKSGVLARKILSQKETPLNEIDTLLKKIGMEHVPVDQADLFKLSAGGGQQDSMGAFLNRIVSLTKSVNSDKTPQASKKAINIIGQNTGFDISVMLTNAYKAGHTDLVKSFLELQKSGMISIIGVEDTYKKLIFRLTQENPQFSGKFRVAFTEPAISMTGRPGGVVSKLSEMRYSTLFTGAESLFGSGGKHGLISKLLPTQILHHAGTDIANTKNFFDFMNEMEGMVKDRTGKTVDELIDTQAGGKHLTEVFNEMFEKNKGNVSPQFKNAPSNVDELLTESVKRSDSYVKWAKDTFGSRFESQAGKISDKGFKGFLNYSKHEAKNLGKYKGVLLASAAILATTFLTLDKEDSLDFKGGSKVKALNGIGKFKKNMYQKYSEDRTKAMDFYRGIVLPIGVPVALVGMVGYGMAKRKNNLLQSFKRPLEDKSVGGLLKAGFKNFRYGMRTIESLLPLARALQISSTIDLLVGSKDVSMNIIKKGAGVATPKRIIGQTDKMFITGKAHSFSNIKNFKLLEAHEKGNGTLIDELLSGTRNLDPSKEADLLKILKPTREEALKIKDRIIRIGSVKGKGTFIYYEDLDNAGKKFSNTITLDLNTSIVSSRLQNTIDGRSEKKIKGLKNVGERNQTINQSAWVRAEEIYSDYLRETGQTLSEDDFVKLKMGKMPKSWSDNPGLQKSYEWYQRAKHKLRLGKKGIGEIHNEFNPKEERLSGVKTSILVRGSSNPNKYFTPENLSQLWNHYGKIPSGLLMSSADSFFETPFQFLGVDSKKADAFFGKLGASSNKFANITGKVLETAYRPGLGLGYGTTGRSLPRFMKDIALKRILPAYVLYQGFTLADRMLGAATFSPDGRGPLTTIPIKAFQMTQLAYSKISDLTGMTKIAKWQEEVAPGSTGLGIFAPALGAVSTFKAAEVLKRLGPKPIQNIIDKGINNIKSTSFFQSALKESAIKAADNKTAFQKAASFMIKNPKMAIFGAMMSPMIPFLPGFLGSNKSYVERKAEFDGDREVAIRKYRGWMLSSSPFAGGRVTQFRHHASYLAEKNWEENGVLWPSYREKAMHQLSLGLYKPHMLEDYHATSQPVYKSAAFGANVPIIGPIIASTIGSVIPEKWYHVPGETYYGQSKGSLPSSLSAGIENLMTRSMYSDASSRTAMGVGIEDPNSYGHHSARFFNQLHDVAGFRGFATETVRNNLFGSRFSDFHQPYYQDATEMYNPAQKLWQFSAGDVTLVGGEFLRRIFPSPRKDWLVNQIPNELSGVSWIPQSGDENKLSKDFTKGTTFDKMPMGWLYASRKGWEFLNPGLKGKDFEQYSNADRLEILQQIGPTSVQAKQEAEIVKQQALDNQLSPFHEQRYYETLDQMKQLKQRVYGSANEYSYSLNTEDAIGTASSADSDTGEFTMDGQQFRVAGVSIQSEDIRARLLQRRKFDSAQELDSVTNEIRENALRILSQNIRPGSRIEGQVIASEHGSSGGVREIIMPGLSEELWNAGVPFADTGNLANYNMRQSRTPIGMRLLGDAWEGMTNEQGFWNKKLISKRDYLQQYLSSNVYNRDVKLWSKPIEHFIKPIIATTAHKYLGYDGIPNFTEKRRQQQQYWDAIKYIKYKRLEQQSLSSNDQEGAMRYNQLWRQTMVGANPTDNQTQDDLYALPQNERDYYEFFSNEVDPKKRAKIYNYLPKAAQRIYKATWARNMAEAGNEEASQFLESIKETEGWELSQEDEKEYYAETGGQASKADWSRQKFIEGFAKNNIIPTESWSGWDEGVSLDNVQLLSLQDQGEQVQDYGFFDNKRREAAFDESAYNSMVQLRSGRIYDAMNNGIIGQMRSFIMPGNSNSSPLRINIESNAYDKNLYRLDNSYTSGLSDKYI